MRRGICRSCLLLFLAIAIANAEAVVCRNSDKDARALQRALDRGGNVLVSGHCLVGSTTLAIRSNTSITGPAVLTYSGNGYLFASSGNGVTISGLTLEGGGIHLTLRDENTWMGQSGWTITHNTIQNISSDTAGVYVDNILGKGDHSSISHNVFRNIWDAAASRDGKRETSCHGIYFHNGLDNTLIDDNHFDHILGNGIKGFLDAFAGHQFGFTGHHIQISNNDLSDIARIGIEVQSAGKGSCPGGCDHSSILNDGTIVKGNYIHNFHTPIGNQFAFSLMFGSTNGQFINNSAVNSKAGPCEYRLGIALETTMNGGIVQGNTMASVALDRPCQKDGGGPVGWQSIEASGYTSAGYTNYWSNNIYCQPNSNWHNTDGYDAARYVYEAEFQSTTCPHGFVSETSSIAVAFLPPRDSDPSQPNRRFDLGVSSNLAIRNVVFCLDACTSSIAAQEIQDMNPDFARDPKWHYHAIVNTAALSPGTHTIEARATDVSGATQGARQPFTVGGH